MIRKRLALVPLATLVLTGCIFPDQITKIEQSVAEVRDRLAKVEKEQADSRQKLAEIATKLSSEDPLKRQDFADLKLRVDEMARQMTALDDRIQDADRRVDRLSQDVVVGKEMSRRLPTPPPADPTAPATVPGAPAPIPSPEALYNAAYADFSKGNYALAISGFEEYASRFPQSDLADNALYWIGECHFGQGSFGAAIQAFDRMLEAYPKGDRAAAANLKKGLALLEDNKVGQAIVQLRYVVATYPGSDEARVARDKLASLGKSGP